MASTPTAPVFRQMKTRGTFLGVCGKDYAKMGALLVACLLAFFLTGLIQAPTLEDRSASDIADASNEYVAMRDAAAYVESAMAKYSATDPAQVDLPQDKLDLYRAAQKAGIDAGMSNEEVKALVPTQEVVVEPVVGNWARALGLVALPIVLFFFAHHELSFGTNAVKEASRYIACQRAQHVYTLNRKALFEGARDAE